MSNCNYWITPAASVHFANQVHWYAHQLLSSALEQFWPNVLMAWYPWHKSVSKLFRICWHLSEI